jgi:hypothetical protein
MVSRIGAVDEATHGGGKRDATKQGSAENRLSARGPRDTPGPVRKGQTEKTIPKKPVAKKRS